MLDLTIAIPVKNEASNLPEGFRQSIGTDFAQSIVVIDSGSSDTTRRQVAEGFGAKVIQFDWNGQFPKNATGFYANTGPATRWVLFLDADEYLTDAFRGELQQAIQKSQTVGYWLNYNIYFLGKLLQGGYPLKKLALFLRFGAGEYERIDEAASSHLDMEIHEHPELDGPNGETGERIDHRDFRGLDSWANKHNEYAAWEAKRYLQRGEDLLAGSWTFKRKVKYRLMAAPGWDRFSSSLATC